MTAPPRVRAIIAQVAADHGVTPDAIVGRDRHRAYAWPRQAAMAAQHHPVAIVDSLDAAVATVREWGLCG